MSKDIQLGSLKPLLIGLGAKLSRYRVVIYVLFVVAVYGFIVFRINSLSTAQPSADVVSAQKDPIKSAHIDPKVIKQLESLRDNDVSVKTLFDQARNNPFEDQ